MFTRDSTPMSPPPRGGTTVRCSKRHAVTTLSAGAQVGSGEARSFTCPECGEKVSVRVKEVPVGR